MSGETAVKRSFWSRVFGPEIKTELERELIGLGALQAVMAGVAWLFRKHTHNEEGKFDTSVAMKNAHKYGLIAYNSREELIFVQKTLLRVEEIAPRTSLAVRVFCDNLGPMHYSDLAKAINEISCMNDINPNHRDINTAARFLIELMKIPPNKRISLLYPEVFQYKTEAEYPKERIKQYALDLVRKLKALDNQLKADYGNAAETFRNNAISDFGQFLEDRRNRKSLVKRIGEQLLRIIKSATDALLSWRPWQRRSQQNLSILP